MNSALKEKQLFSFLMSEQILFYIYKINKSMHLLPHCAHLARDTLILQPPENFLVGLFCISEVKDKPAKILRALASAAAAPIALNSS